VGLESRLRKLEGAALQEVPDWPLEDQLESVAQKIYDVKFFHQYHNPEHKYWCTDREIRLAMYIAEIIEAEREGEAPPYDPARYRVAKIPEIFAPYLRRWETGSLGGPQSERDRWLYNNRHRAKADRERIAWERSPEGRRAKALERVEAARRDLDYRNGVRVRYFAEPPIPEQEDERLSKALDELAEIEAELEAGSRE
jgi:hypothetical protein